MKVVILGAHGRLGAALIREYRDKFEVVGFNHAQLDLGKPEEIHAEIDKLDFDVMIKRAREEEQINAIADKFSTPTYTHDIAEMVSRFFDVDVPGGFLHFANNGECSWQEYAQHALDCCRASGISLKAKTVGALKLADMKNWIARRPVYSVLSTAKYAKLTSVTPRSWRDAVSDYIERSYSIK